MVSDGVQHGLGFGLSSFGGFDGLAHSLSLSRLARASWVHVAFAFLAMGGWALFANRGHPQGEAVTAALVQGAMSAAITLGLKRFLEWASARLTGKAALYLPPAISACVTFFLLSAIHRIAGTPEVLATIVVPFAVSTAYAFVYCQTLGRDRRAAETGR